ncbi:NADP-dependent oxidoreductase [Conexibacter sp. SYSU D00693]|uniref:NADP-dependent oxidoreductase n=1 Tax=Conexibacter sp. SYSU D00693 TaxID=2812560 RepID=UPI00196B7AE9|nr:NADP-dependent oxidoreductase [Conexibacter sp. SYSU D00693]
MTSTTAPTTTTFRRLVTAGDGTLSTETAALPEPGPGEVRIRVRAAGITPADLGVRDGFFHQIGLATGSVGLGWDLAGTVDALGPDVDAFAVGDEVLGVHDSFDAAVRGQGEAVVLPLRAVALAPEGVPLDAAATLSLNALTAKQSLDLLALEPGQTLLVTGARGSVGGFAVELARLRGLEVVAVGRGDALPTGVDGALDAAAVGADVLVAVRDGGAFVAVKDPAEPPAERGIRVTTVHTYAQPGELAELSRLAQEGRLTLHVAERFGLDEADAAYARVAEGGLRGRVLLVP